MMKKNSLLARYAVLFGMMWTCLTCIPVVGAASSIDETHKYAWSENTGWHNWHPTQAGVTVEPGHLQGYAWAERIGWVKLGADGSGPYENNAANNWGVNRDNTTGALSGYAWSENAGWVNFNPAHGGVSINRETGDFSGYAWGRNIGWISFSGTAKDSTPYKVKDWNIPPADGDGSIGNPYRIASIENLYWIAADPSRWDKHYTQTAGIDASQTSSWNSGTGWMPLGNSETPFTGTYSGNASPISNLFIHRPEENNQGLFGVIGENGHVDSVGVYNANITANNCAGILAGYNMGQVSNSHAAGQVNGNMEPAGPDLTGIAVCNTGPDYVGSDIGGLVGVNSNIGAIHKSYAFAAANGQSAIGGLVGANSGTVENSYATGAVTGNAGIGGLVANNFGTVSKSYAIGAVTGTDAVGGLTANDFGTVTDSFWDTETSFIPTGNGGTGKTTVEMQTRATFTDVSTEGLDDPWDFTTIWNMDEFNNGYPYVYPRTLLPLAGTQPVTQIGATTATGHGNISSLGSISHPTAHGICWSEAINPTTADTCVDQGAPPAIGAFTADITALNAGTTYYVRAFVTNTLGTSYGSNRRFTTLQAFTVTGAAGAGGSINPTSRTVPSGQTTTFTVTPDPGFGIKDVDGCGGTLSGNTYTTGPITSACTVSATFSLYTLSVTNGTGSGEYKEGAVIKIQAQAPVNGKIFDKWIGAVEHVVNVNNASTKISMPASDISVTATYKNAPLDTYALSVSKGAGTGTYAVNNTVSIMADVPGPGQIFLQWTGDVDHVANVNNPNTTVTMPAANIAVEATYKLQPSTPHTLTVINGSGGGKYKEGAVANIAATPQEDMIFDEWTGNTANVANRKIPNTTVIMPGADVTVTANYKTIPAENFALTVNSGTGSGSYQAGRVVRVTAAPPPAGRIFDIWTGDTARLGDVNALDTTIVMPDADASIAATYRNQPVENFTLTVVGGTGSGEYRAGTVQAINAEHPPLQMFDKWTGQTGRVANVNLPSTSVTMPASDVTVSANHIQRPINERTLTFFAWFLFNSSTTLDVDTLLRSSTPRTEESKNPGEWYPITVPDRPGYDFLQWEGQTHNVEDVNSQTTRIYMPDNDVVLVAAYTPQQDPNPAAIPTLSEWGLIIMSVLMLIAGAIMCRRRKQGLM